MIELGYEPRLKACAVCQGSLTLELQTGTLLWPVRNWVTHQGMSSGGASKPSSVFTSAHIAFKQVALPQQKTQASYLMMIVDCLVPYTTELKHV